MSEDDVSDDDWFESALKDATDDDTEPSEDRERATDESSATYSETTAESGSLSTRESDHGGPFSVGDASDTSDASGTGDSPFGDSDAGSPFDDASNPFDGDIETTDADDGGLFDDDFASAFESAGSGDDGDSGFEEELDSDIPRVDIGIDGLDRMIQGGVPERHLIVTIGSAGTGKTTFGLQFLHHGLQNGENAVFLTLEQSHEEILDTAGDRGWGFKKYEEEGQLAVVDLDPVEMANSLDNIRGELPPLIEEFGADRLVLDSVSLLEMMYDDQSRRRTEVFDFTRSLKEAGVTTMLVSEASENNPFASRHGIIEYLTDAVFILQYVRSDTRKTRLSVEIQKIRNANHSRETKPYEITSEGISVYQQANIF
ncbi:MAG: KaiC domain-containing protein [Haloarcula sp.]